VALRELSRHEILQAVAEYDRLGQNRFLAKYGFGAARSYRLLVDGKTYDSKAIVARHMRWTRTPPRAELRRLLMSPC
jgi:hypothetical protein